MSQSGISAKFPFKNPEVQEKVKRLLMKIGPILETRRLMIEEDKRSENHMEYTDILLSLQLVRDLKDLILGKPQKIEKWDQIPLIK